jgi:thiol-disulfide isomerase/thioredoxin
VKAIIQPAPERKPAPELGLEGNDSKPVLLKEYRGKIVVLDFWATWCHGCREEIPWFAEFEHKYSGKGLRVIGVSLDEDGWKVVKPFIQAADVPYRIALGNDAVEGKYGVSNMPDTFLLDRNGCIAATYGGPVDKLDIERNIRILLSQ